LSERVAVITSSYPREPGDAAGHFVASEVRRWLEQGAEVHVFAPGVGQGERDGDTLASSGKAARGEACVHWVADGGAFGWPGALARLRERPLRAVGAAAFTLGVRRTLRSVGPFTRVQAHFLVPCAWPIATTAFGPAREMAFELVGHGSDVRLFCGLPSALRGHIARAWLRRGAHLRVTSEELAARLRAANPELSEVLWVKPSPLELGAVLSRREARASLGIAANARVALVVSRLVPEKRVAVALRALSLVDGVSAIVVGDGPESSALRTEFPSVRFVGHVARPTALAYIAAADVLVSASRDEGAPSVVREARALGVAVVAVAAGDLAEWANSDPGIFAIR